MKRVIRSLIAAAVMVVMFTVPAAAEVCLRFVDTYYVGSDVCNDYYAVVSTYVCESGVYQYLEGVEADGHCYMV